MPFKAATSCGSFLSAAASRSAARSRRPLLRKPIPSLARYAAEPGCACPGAVRGALPPHARVEARFGDQAQLYGHTRADGTYAPGDVVHIDFYWRALRQPDANYSLRLRLMNDQGLVVHEISAEPVFAELPTSAWPVGDLIRGQANLLLPGDLASGRYQLQAQLVSQAGRALPVSRSWRPLWSRDELSLAHLEVRAP